MTRVGDANDLEMLCRAFKTFKNTHDRPTLIIVDSHIAWGAPNKQDTHGAHGSPLGEEEIRLAKRNYGWPEEGKFLVPQEALQYYADHVGKRGDGLRDAWMALFASYEEKYPELAKDLYAMQHRQLPGGWDEGFTMFPPDAKGMATRDSSGKVLNAAAKHIPWLIGGAADLAPSTKTRLSLGDDEDFLAGHYSGRNLHFGVREHAMGAILNGLSLCKMRPFGAGFLIFSDYGRPPIRLAAIMEIPVIYIFTHDSIGVGEDGPTHQPVEQLVGLRSIPGLIVIRPCDANEVVEAWKVTLEMRHHPVCLILSRQNLPTLDRSRYAPAEGLRKGAYVLADDGKRPDAILIATGSEVPLALEARDVLHKEGLHIRVVSMPSWELFENQTQEYRDSVLPPEVTARVSIEKGSTIGWERYVGSCGRCIGMTTFGASAPLEKLQEKFGFTSPEVVAHVKEMLHLAKA